MLINSKAILLCFLMSLASVSLHADTKLDASQETNGNNNKSAVAARDIIYNITRVTVVNVQTAEVSLEETLSMIPIDNKQLKRALPKVSRKKLKTNIQEMEKKLILCDSRYKNTLEKLKEANDNLKQLKEQLNKNTTKRVSKKESNSINSAGVTKNGK